MNENEFNSHYSQMNGNMNGFEKPVSLVNVFNVLFRHKGIILTCFIAAMVVGSVVTFLMPPVYRASAKLLLEKEPESEKALLFRMNLPDGQGRHDWIKTEIDIIQSHPVAVQVVKELALDELGGDNKPLSEADRARRFELTVKDFEKKLTVDRNQNSNVIEISFENKDPELAVSVVGNVVDTYLNYRSEIYNESETYKFFEEQMLLADGKLRDLEQLQMEYKQNKGVVSPKAQKEILLARLANYEEGLTEARTMRVGKEARLAVIREHLRNGGDLRIPSIESSDSPGRVGHINRLKGNLLDMDIERERLLQNFTPQYKEVTDLDRAIEITREKIREEINEIVDIEEASLLSIEAEEKMILSMIDNTKKEMLAFAQSEHELTQLSRGIDINSEVYSMFLKQREEARISLAKLERGVKIKAINPPFALSDPVRPEKAKYMLLSVFFGLLGGLGLAFFIDHFDHSITTPAELELLTGLNVLGSIRDIDLNGSKSKKQEKKEAVKTG